MTCPRCGTRLAEGQRACLECGLDVAHVYRRPPSWRPWAAVGVLIALAVGAAAGFGIAGVANRNERKKERSVSIAAKTATQGPAPTISLPPPPAPTAPAAPAAPAPALPTWPAGKTAYTVVLVSAKVQAQAEAKAREAITRGIQAGVLDSSSYAGLPPGQWIVFAGQYPTAAVARSHASTYDSQGFASAYPRKIKPK